MLLGSAGMPKALAKRPMTYQTCRELVDAHAWAWAWVSACAAPSLRRRVALAGGALAVVGMLLASPSTGEARARPPPRVG